MLQSKFWRFAAILSVCVWIAGVQADGVRPVKVHLGASGVVPPVMTSLNDDQSVNFHVIPHYAKYLSDKGITSFCVAGPSSDGWSLSLADRKRLVYEWSLAMKSTALRHMMVVVGGTPMADALDLAHYGEKVGADALIVLADMVYRPRNVDDVINYLLQIQHVAPNTALVYYYAPTFTGADVDMVKLTKEANKRVRNFRGIYYSSNDLPGALQVKRELKDGSRLFMTNAKLLSAAKINGIDSVIGTEYSVFPHESLEIMDALDKNDVHRAQDLQHRITGALEDINKEGAFLPTVKAALDSVTGFKMGIAGLQYPQVSPTARERITHSLQNWGFSVARDRNNYSHLWMKHFLPNQY